MYVADVDDPEQNSHWDEVFVSLRLYGIALIEHTNHVHENSMGGPR